MWPQCHLPTERGGSGFTQLQLFPEGKSGPDGKRRDPSGADRGLTEPTGTGNISRAPPCFRAWPEPGEDAALLPASGAEERPSYTPAPREAAILGTRRCAHGSHSQNKRALPDPPPLPTPGRRKPRPRDAGVRALFKVTQDPRP